MTAQDTGAAIQSAAEGNLSLWGNLSLGDPWFLALLPLFLLLFFSRARRRQEVAGRVPVLPVQHIKSLRQRVAWLPSALNWTALVLVVIALARPLEGDVETSTQTEGVDIALLLDRSSSMAADDLERAQLQSALDEIEVEYRARSLDRARGVYRERNGRDIASVADLVEGPGAVLAHLPSAAPSSLPVSLRNGAEWTLEPDTRRIVSDYYGRRYEISVHALDRQRNQEWRRLREGASDDA